MCDGLCDYKLRQNYVVIQPGVTAKIGKVSFGVVDVVGKIQTKYLPNKLQVEGLTLERVCLTESFFYWTWGGWPSHIDTYLTNPSTIMWFKFQLLPRTEGYSVHSTLTCINIRTMHQDGRHVRIRGPCSAPKTELNG